MSKRIPFLMIQVQDQEQQASGGCGSSFHWFLFLFTFPILFCRRDFFFLKKKKSPPPPTAPSLILFTWKASTIWLFKAILVTGGWGRVIGTMTPWAGTRLSLGKMNRMGAIVVTAIPFCYWKPWQILERDLCWEETAWSNPLRGFNFFTLKKRDRNTCIPSPHGLKVFMIYHESCFQGLQIFSAFSLHLSFLFFLKHSCTEHVLYTLS